MSGWRLTARELAARGDTPAIAGRGSGVIRYAELANRAAAVAAALAESGVHPGEPVAIVSAGRAHDEPVALAGILEARAVAVPLDATAPPARLAAIAAARGCRAFVCDEAAEPLVDRAEASASRTLGRVVVAPDGSLRGIRRSATDAPRISNPATVACILHTSGSTGTPKPVPISWEGLDAFTAWMIGLVSLREADRVLRVAELLFDLAWFDHLATWRAGATLVTMSRRDLASGRAVVDALAELGPTVVYGVPSLYMKLVAALAPGAAIPNTPRALLFAGEVFPPRELRAFSERAPGAALFNLYGPTETNVCTYHRVHEGDLDGARDLPIGVACPYASCKLVALDGSGALLEGAATGELVVEGPTTVGGGPYATRDRVERGADGLFYFRGRIDRMVKVRGYRVDPGEVEVALAGHPAVRQAAVVAHEDPRLGKTLRAFVLRRTTDAAPVADERALRTHLAEILPPYMVPDRVYSLDAMPITTTGKVDYEALRGAASTGRVAIPSDCIGTAS